MPSAPKNKYMFRAPTVITGVEYVEVYAGSYEEALQRVRRGDVDMYVDTEEHDQNTNWKEAKPCS